MVEPVDQNGLIRLMGSGGVAAGSSQNRHPPRVYPVYCFGEQGSGDIGIVGDIEEAEESDLLSGVLVEPMVHGGRDAPQQATAVAGDEVGDLGVLVIRVSRREKTGEPKEPTAQQLSIEGGCPVWIAAEQVPWDLNERSQATISQSELLYDEPHAPCPSHGMEYARRTAWLRGVASKRFVTYV